MWICQHCQTENRESAPSCQVCGAVRAAGRFGSAPRQDPRSARPPRITAANPDGAPRPSSDKNGYAVPETEIASPPRRKKSRLCGAAKGVGGVVCVLLPLLTLFLAYCQYDPLSAALTPLLGPKAPAWTGTAFYALLALSAALLALLPGLWTLLLAKAAEAMREMRERTPETFSKH